MLDNHKIRAASIGSLLFLLVGVMACERPSKPSFETEQVYSLPLIRNTEYRLLGSAGSIIDTTRSNFSDRFDIEEGTGRALLGFESDMPYGSFNHVLPEFETEPVIMESGLDGIMPDVQADNSIPFDELTGMSASQFPAGSELPGGSSGQLEISLNPAGFDTAEIMQGGLKLRLSNELGIDLESVQFQLISAGQPSGSQSTIFNFTNESEHTSLVIPAPGSTLQAPLKLRFSTSWPTQSVDGSEGQLAVSLSATDNLLVSEAISQFPKLTLIDEYETEISISKFEFTSPGDYVDISTAELQFSNIINQFDVDFDTLQFSFPTIRRLDSAGNPIAGDSLVVTRTGASRILRSTAGGDLGNSFSIDLEDVRISSVNNRIPVNIFGITEDTRLAPPGDRVRTIRAEQTLSAIIESTTFDPTGALGLLKPTIVVVSNDEIVGDDADLDVLDTEQHFPTNFNELIFLSERLEGVLLTDTSIDLEYTTDLGIETIVYSAILGRNEMGEEFFLTGISDSPYYVSPQDTVDGFLFDGVPIPQDQLFQFPTERATGNQKQVDTHRLTNQNSNVDEFLSKFPTEILMVSKALTNPDIRQGSVELPVAFDLLWRVNIPFSLVTDQGPATFSDQLEVSLSSLPDRRDDVYISEAEFTLVYQNRLPLDVDIRLTFLNALEDSITGLPFDVEERIRMLSAPTGTTGYSLSVRQETVRLSLNDSQLERLNQSEFIGIEGELITSDFKPINLRGSDYINMDLRSRFVIRAKVD